MRNPSVGQSLLSPYAAIDFYKYSVYGNTFVLVDELHGRQLSEYQKSALAGLVIDERFGIGCDNLIFIQPYTDDLIHYVGKSRGYWSSGPQNRIGSADLVFRMFEPDGTEALCCGNGLLCIAHHLRRRYGIEAAEILTEVPSAKPVVRRLEGLTRSDTCSVKMGRPVPLPSRFTSWQTVTMNDGSVGIAHDVPIFFRVRAMDGTFMNFRLSLGGFLTYTGEPHLVILDNQEESPKTRTAAHTKRDPFGSAPSTGACSRGTDGDVSICLDMRSTVETILNGHKEGDCEDTRSNFGPHLLQRIGSCLNAHDSPLFPSGINLNFARVLDPDEGIVEYRCFERGIRKETLACGSGAVAVAATVHQYGLVHTDTVRLWPKSSRIHDPLAELRASRDVAGNWWLEGVPRLVFSGFFELPEFDFSLSRSIASSLEPLPAAFLKERVPAWEIHL